MEKPKFKYTLLFDKKTNSGIRTFVMTSESLNELINFIHKSNLERGKYKIINQNNELVLN